MKFIMLTEVFERGQDFLHQRDPDNESRFGLREIIINSHHIVSIRDASIFKSKIEACNWSGLEDLDKRVYFCKIYLSSASGTSSIVYVAGDIHTIKDTIGTLDN